MLGFLKIFSGLHFHSPFCTTLLESVELLLLYVVWHFEMIIYKWGEIKHSTDVTNHLYCNKGTNKTYTIISCHRNQTRQTPTTLHEQQNMWQLKCQRHSYLENKHSRNWTETSETVLMVCYSSRLTVKQMKWDIERHRTQQIWKYCRIGLIEPCYGL